VGFIAGIIDFKKAINIDGKIDLLKRSTSSRLSQLEFTPLSNKLSNNGFLVSEQPLTFFKQRLSWLAIDGSIESILCDLDTPDAESVMCKTPFVGEYSCCYFDGETESIFLRKGLTSTHPIYYSQSGSQLAWASDIKSLLALLDDSPEVDEFGLADYLGTKKSENFRTYFKNIFSVEVGSVVKFSAASVTKFTVEAFANPEPKRNINFGDACSELSFLFARSVINKCAHLKPAVSLSGGLDSSSIFSAALEFQGQIGHAPVGITYLYPAGIVPEQLNGVAALEKQLNFKSQYIHVEDHLDFLNSYRDQVWTTETPFLDPFWGVKTAVCQEAKSKGCQVLLTGRWGNQLTPSNSGIFDQFLMTIRSVFTWTPSRETTEDFRHKRQILRNDCLNKSAASLGMKVGLPFLDRELIQFLLSLPGEIINYSGVSRGLYRHSIGKSLPLLIKEYSHHNDVSSWVHKILSKELEIIRGKISPRMEVIRRGYVNAKPLSDIKKAQQLLEIYALETWLEEFTVGFFKRIRSTPNNQVEIKLTGQRERDALLPQSSFGLGSLPIA